MSMIGGIRGGNKVPEREMSMGAGIRIHGNHDLHRPARHPPRREAKPRRAGTS